MHGWRPAGFFATAGALLLVTAGVIAPPPSATGAPTVATLSGQSVALAPDAAPLLSVRDSYGSDFSPQRQKELLVADHTNYSWAKLVLWYGGWPITDDSVTTIVRWMRQENFVDSWWNRNNPLNNGWGVGNYMNSAASLDDAARFAADAIHTLGGYSGIRTAFANAVSPAEAATAIWYSSWASGHYAYGSHWSTAPVPEVEAPASAWGI
jgi:hypothetical protein